MSALVIATITDIPYVKPVYSVEAFRTDCKEIIARGAKTFYKEWWQSQARRYLEWKAIWSLSIGSDEETADLIQQVEDLRKEATGWSQVSDSDSD